jgi:hypothetical protein
VRGGAIRQFKGRSVVPFLNGFLENVLLFLSYGVRFFTFQGKEDYPRFGGSIANRPEAAQQATIRTCWKPLPPL